MNWRKINLLILGVLASPFAALAWSIIDAWIIRFVVKLFDISFSTFNFILNGVYQSKFTAEALSESISTNGVKAKFDINTGLKGVDLLFDEIAYQIINPIMGLKEFVVYISIPIAGVIFVAIFSKNIKNDLTFYAIGMAVVGLFVWLMLFAEALGVVLVGALMLF